MTTTADQPDAQRPRNVKRGYLDALVRSGIWASLSFKAAKLIVAIYHHTSSRRGTCHPGGIRLGEESGISDPSVTQARAELVEAGLIRCRPLGAGKEYEIVPIAKDEERQGHADLEGRIARRKANEASRQASRRSRLQRGSVSPKKPGGHDSDHDGHSDGAVPQDRRGPSPNFSESRPPTPPCMSPKELAGNPAQPNSNNPAKATQTGQPHGASVGKEPRDGSLLPTPGVMSPPRASRRAATLEATQHREGSVPGVRPRDAGGDGALDPTTWFACSICVPPGQGWAGQLCLDPEHLRQELRREGVRKHTIFVGKYQPLLIRRQIGAIRFLTTAYPDKVKKPATYLAESIKKQYALPDELKSTWDEIIAHREAAAAKRAKAQRDAQRERHRQPYYETLDPWLAQLGDDARRVLEQEVHDWARNGGAAKAEAEGFDLDAPALEGPNRYLLVWFLKLARPDLVRDAPELSRSLGLAPSRTKEAST